MRRRRRKRKREENEGRKRRRRKRRRRRRRMKRRAREGEEGKEEENDGRKRRRRWRKRRRRRGRRRRGRRRKMRGGTKPACSPAEEGEQITLSCTVNTAKTCNNDIKSEWFVDSYTNRRLLGCSNAGCGSFFQDIFSSTDSGSTLTISKVSRTVPVQFSMETRWTCRYCGGPEVAACNMLEIYAKPENPSCTVGENTAVPGDIESVTVSCSTTKVYPKAKCSFERRTSGGASITINKTPTYNHTELAGTPVYYRSECSVDLPVAELGEGIHTFRAFIYPDVTDGINLVTATTASTTVTLTLPGASSYTCSPEMIQGYFNGKSARCTCSLTSNGYPKGQAQWYRGGQTVPGVSGEVLDLTFDRDTPKQVFTCKGVSAIGEGSNTTLTAKFSYAPVVTFSHDSASSQFNEGDTPTFTCTAQGNPPPNLTITRKRTNQHEASVQGNLKTADLVHTVDPIDCLDTDVYVCIGQNNQGVTTKESFVGVKCPQKLISNISQPEAVEVVIHETAELGLEIYGYPNPQLLTLMRTRDNTNLAGSARHLIEYSPGQAPFGVVNATIFNVGEEDYTNYTITVVNGVGDALVYPFYLVEVNATDKPSVEKQGGSGNDNVGIVVGVTVAVVAVFVIAVILVILVLRHRVSKKSPLFQPAKENRYVNIFPDPADGYEVPVTQPEGEGMRPEGHTQVRINAYEEIDPRSVNEYEMSDGPAQEGHRQLRTNQYEEINPHIVNEYDVPNGLIQEEDMRPKALATPPSYETVQQPYANYTSSQQETSDTKNSSYSNLGFDTSKEKCIYVNTQGHDTSQESDHL
ncbi:neural cell adhesion molecule 1 [Plakobranchus ocellatus]|uniref:Neural cell adhesion molecule 1 n=1 Tax=Plakobranchus ocellatus TaxID=259542 RepID=A0AAV3ZV51_9GAST|nr:neural cell adhesion molecule 1 [Plakobranchus ocellatus]